MNLRASLGTLLSVVALGCSSEAEAPSAGVGGATTSAGNASTAGASGATTAGGSGNTAGIGTAGGSDASGSGMAGMSEGGAAMAGAGMSTGGTAASGAGGSGTAGKGTGGSATYDVPRGASAGCGKDATDEPGKYVKHELDVKGVDPAFEMAHPLSPGNNGGYTYERRNYFIQLPPGYDKTKPYPLTIGGSGCGDTSGLSGRNGGQQPSGMTAIQVGLSYVYSGGACFEDGYENTPEVPYFDAVLAELEDSYCIDKEKVFLSGFSSGSWEAITLGLARGGIVRGIATGAGGLREKRPTPSRIPMAAILLTGKNDGANPIEGPTGSAAARDLILATNGCVGAETKAFAGDADCKQYTGCPAAFPVVWCEPAGEHMAGSEAHWKAVGEFWSALPAVP